MQHFSSPFPARLQTQCCPIASLILRAPPLFTQGGSVKSVIYALTWFFKVHFYFALYRLVTLLLLVFTREPTVLEFRCDQTGHFWIQWASLVAQLVKNLPAMRETWVLSLGWEDPLEKGKTTHSSILAWRIPCTVYSLGSQWGSGTIIMCTSGDPMPLDSKEIQPVHPKGNQS